MAVCLGQGLTVTAAPLVICHGHSPQDWRLESWLNTPPSSGPGEPLGPASCSGCPVNTGFTEAVLFISTLFFLMRCSSLSLSLSSSVSASVSFFSLSLYTPPPLKNRRSAARLPGKRRAMPPSLSLPLCQLYLNKYGLS